MCSLGWSAEYLDEPESQEPSLEQQLVDGNVAIAEWLDSTAEGIDLFISGKRFSDLKNESRIRLDNSSFSKEGDNFHNISSLSVILRLPNVEEYWQLKFSSYDEGVEKRNVQKSYLHNTPRERNYGATLGLFRKLGQVRTAFQPRIDLSDPLKVSHSLSFESIADYGTFDLNPKFEFFASPDRGTGFFVALNAFFLLTAKTSLTLINTGEYEDRKHQLLTAQGLSFGQALNSKSSLAYSLIFNSSNRDNYHLESYVFSLAWSRMLYKKILDCQVVPHLEFARDLRFKGQAGISFNLGVNF